MFIYSRIQEGIADYIPSLDQGLAVLTNSTVAGAAIKVTSGTAIRTTCGAAVGMASEISRGSCGYYW